MSKKYEAYEKAREAEVLSKARYLMEPNAQNEADAANAEGIANATFQELMEEDK